MSYVELTARSHFSFLRGASSPAQLLERAQALGYDALGLTDCDGLYGMVRAHQAAQQQGVRLVVGCALSLACGPGQAPLFSTVHVWVESHSGYSRLCQLLSLSHGERRQPPAAGGGALRPRNVRAGLAPEALCTQTAGLWAMADVDGGEDTAAEARLAMLREAFGERFSLGVQRPLDGSDAARQQRARELGQQLQTPVLAHNAVRYALPSGKPLYDVLHCIREGCTLMQAGRALAPNAEAHLKSPAQMQRLFAHAPAWLGRTRDIAEACRFRMDELHYRFPCELDGEVLHGQTPDTALRRLTWEGAAQRYAAGIPEAVRCQLEKELALIAQLQVAPYFLSVQQIVSLARQRGILCQGRGSAANSAVCFCLGITAVDPSRSNLLFERFLSAERHEPPDIDVDFEHERREEVIQEIYRRYGRDRAAMVSEVITYRRRSAQREVAKVFGLPADATLPPTAQAMADALRGTPRHLSIHVGGFVLSAAPLHEVAPIEPAAKADRTVIPWDKDDLDALGFFKVDVLGLGMLTAIRKALALVQHDARVQAEGAIEQLARIPPEDPAVYQALCAADTVGVFQIESRAQMAMLPRLRPQRFYDLVIEVALVRPGPIQGGMVHPYLRRRNGEEAATVPHARLAPILERTLGVPLFQEQVMQIAIVGAGYSGGEADQLRRDMAAWRKHGRLEGHRQRLLAGFAARGIDAAFGERLYAQIQGFGEYGFPESHAASFALLVYASAWLKVHHPAAFAAALLNSQPMGFYAPQTLLQDAKRHGVPLRPVSVLASDWDCTLEPGEQPGSPPALRLGLRQVRSLGRASGQRLVQARSEAPFSHLADLKARTSLRQNELDALAAAGALQPWFAERRQAMWQARHAGERRGLFAGLPPNTSEPAAVLPTLHRGEQLLLDFHHTGCALHDHPLALLRPSLPKTVRSSAELARMRHGSRVESAGLVLCRQRPATASGVVFLTLEDEFGFLNLVLFAKVFSAYENVVCQASLLRVRGTLERHGQVIHVLAEHLSPLPLSSLRLSTGASTGALAISRDFH